MATMKTMAAMMKARRRVSLSLSAAVLCSSFFERTTSSG